MRNAFLLLSAVCVALAATSTFAAEPSTDVMSAKYREIWSAEEQARIDADIEANRKADASVELPNVADGTSVRVVQIESSFKFGGNTFLFGQFDTDEKNQAYASIFGDLFDAATVAFYWKTLEPEQGKPRYEASSSEIYRRPPTDPVVDYCRSRGLDVHGHAIIYGMRRWAHPEWLPADRKEMEPFFEKHVRELAERYGDRVDEWDVVNESIDQANRGLMPDDYTYKTFAWAKKYFPENVRFSSNECDVSWGPNRRYVEIVRDLIERGARVDMVGVQAHLFGADQAAQIAAGADLSTPKKLRAVFKTLEETERPVHVSEVTISAPSDDEKGRQIQAEVARNLYRLWFSIPNVARITWWNVADGGAAGGEPSFSGIVDANCQKKPVYDALYRLIREEWRTETTVETKDGRVAWRGFRGRYRLEWTDAQGNARSLETDLN